MPVKYLLGNNTRGRMNRCVSVCICLLCCGSCARSSIEPPSVASGRDIVVEAESPHRAIGMDGHSWRVERELEGGPPHLVAVPSVNTVFDRKHIATVSPSVAYRVMFMEAGTYYLWVKGKGEAGGASVIPGLDGAPLTEDADFIGFFPYDFSWLGGLHDTGKRTVLRIEHAGEHVVNFWMLEDGFRFDKFMITTGSDVSPNQKEPNHTSDGMVAERAEPSR